MLRCARCSEWFPAPSADSTQDLNNTQGTLRVHGSQGPCRFHEGTYRSFYAFFGTRLPVHFLGCQRICAGTAVCVHACVRACVRVCLTPCVLCLHHRACLCARARIDDARVVRAGGPGQRLRPACLSAGPAARTSTRSARTRTLASARARARARMCTSS